MQESKIYFYIKKYLKDTGWSILGGEPPDGSNDIKRIEIRDPGIPSKGSKGSLKIDIVSSKGPVLLLIEIKPAFDTADVRKLNYILEERRHDLFDALFERCNLKEGTFKYVLKCLAVNKVEKEQLPAGFIVLHLDNHLHVDVLLSQDVDPEILSFFKK